MTHAPVTALVDGELKIIPIWPLQAGAVWKDVIGFDSHEKMPAELVADAYVLKVWARAGTSLHQHHIWQEEEWHQALSVAAN